LLIKKKPCNLNVVQLHLAIYTTPCVEVWQTSNMRQLKLGKEKKIEEDRR